MGRTKFPPGAAEDIITLYEDIMDFLIDCENPPLDNYEVYIVTRQAPLEVAEVFRMFKIYAVLPVTPVETNVTICGDMTLIKRVYDNEDRYSNEILITLLKRGVQIYVYFDTRKEEAEDAEE